MIGLYLCRRRPTLPHTFACSTIGPAGLNCRVRDGNGWIPRGKITDKLEAFARRLSRSPKSRAKPRDLYATYSQRTRELSNTTEYNIDDLLSSMDNSDFIRTTLA